jgi:hypothetical protein
MPLPSSAHPSMPAWSYPSHPHQTMGGIPEGLMAPLPATTEATTPLPSSACPSSPAWSTPSPPTTTGGGATAAEHPATTTLQCWKRRIWLSPWFAQQAEQVRGASTYVLCVVAHRRTPCRFGVIADHLQPRPTKPLTQRSSVIPSGIMVCRYHEGGGCNSTIVLVVARVEGVGPVLPILEGGRCAYPFVSGLHRLRWQHRFFGGGPGGQNLHPTSHPTPLSHVSNWPTGLTSIGSHDTTIPLSLCYSLAFPSASCAVVIRLIVLSNWHTKSTSDGIGMIGM